jgi:hypothetical protein
VAAVGCAMDADMWSAVTAAVIIPATLRAWPESLSDGPLPLPFPTPAGDARADRTTRSTYFNAHTARVLYGAAGSTPSGSSPSEGSDRSPRRGYRWVEASLSELVPTRMTAVEVLAHGAPDEKRAFIVAHLCLPAEKPLTELQALTMARKTRIGNPLLDLLDGGASSPLGNSVADIPGTTRPFAVTLAIPRGKLPDGPYGLSFPWDPLRQWLFAFASARTSGRFPADPEDTSLLQGLVRLSQDWSALVLRDGAAFVGRVSAEDSGYLGGSADAYVRSIYLDAFLLGQIQLEELGAITDKLASLGGSLDRLNELLSLEEDVSRFRNTYWWQHLTSHGTGNKLLAEFQRQHAMPELFEQVIRELDDYSRHATLRADRQEQQQLSRVNILLSLLTVLTVPMTLMQIMVDSHTPRSWTWRWVLTGAAAALLLVVFARFNRRKRWPA